MDATLARLADTIDNTLTDDGEFTTKTAEPVTQIIRALSNCDLLFDEFEINGVTLTHEYLDGLAQTLELAAPALVQTPASADKMREISTLLRLLHDSPFADCFLALCLEPPTRPPSTSWSGPRIKSDPSLLDAPCIYWSVGTIEAEVRVHPSYDGENDLIGWFPHLVLRGDEDGAELLDTVDTLPEAMQAAHDRIYDIARSGDAEVRLG